METETYSSQPSKINRYTRQLSVFHSTMIPLLLNATLPSGMTVEEYWKNIK